MKSRVVLIALVAMAFAACASTDSAPRSASGVPMAMGDSEFTASGPSAARYFVDAMESWEDVERAIGFLDRAIEIDPGFAVALYERGNRYRKIDQHREALGDYTAAIEADPQFLQAYRARFDLRAHQLGDDNAVEDLERAYEIDPSHLPTALALAGHLAWKEPERARDIYDELVSSEPDEVQPRIDRGMFYANRGAYDEALEDLTTAVSMGSAPPWVLAEVIQMRLALGQTREARQDASRLLEMHPEKPETALAAARVEAFTGRPAAAAPLYERYSRYEWADAGVWLELAMLRAANGDRSGAEAAISQFQAKKGDADRVRTARLGVQLLLGDRERALGGLEAITGEKDWDLRPWYMRALAETGAAATEVQAEARNRFAQKEGGLTRLLVDSPEVWLFARLYLDATGARAPEGLELP